MDQGMRLTAGLWSIVGFRWLAKAVARRSPSGGTCAVVVVRHCGVCGEGEIGLQGGEDRPPIYIRTLGEMWAAPLIGARFGAL